MAMSPRGRFVGLAASGYALASLAWIYCSDRLLADLASTQAMVWLSMAKGGFFVILTTALLIYALNTVPPAATSITDSAPFADASQRGLLQRSASYLFAALVTLAMLLVHHSLAGLLDHHTLPVLLLLPIVVSAWLGGFGPGTLATLLAGLGLDYLALPPLNSLRIDSDHDLLQFTVLCISGLAISLLSHLRLRTQRHLNAQRQLLDAVVTGTTDAIFVKDRDGRYQLANRAFAELLRVTPEEMLGNDDSLLFSDKQARQLREEDLALMREARTHSWEKSLTIRDGRVLDFLVTKGPIYDAAGQVRGVFGIAHDITARKRTEEALQRSETAMRMAQRLANVGNWEWDAASDRQLWSEQTYRIFGLPTDQPPPPFSELRHWFGEKDWTLIEEAASKALSQGEDFAVDAELRDQAGVQHWVSVRGYGRRGSDGKVRQLYGALQDITERKLAELALHQAAMVFDSSHQGIIVVDPQMRISRVNPAFTRITGYTAEEVVGQRPNVLSSGLHDPAFYSELYASLARDGYWSGEVWNRRKSGETYPEMLSISVARDDQGQPLHYIGVFSDLTQIKSQADQLDRMAHFDPLTGLPNRRLLGDRLDQAIARSLRSSHSLAVCYLDIDDFKSINQQGGTALGDSLLVTVGDNLKHVLRSEDTLARLGDDEFVVLLTEIESVEDCSSSLDRMLAAINAPIATEAGEFRLSASIGVCIYPDDDVDAGLLLRHADQAMCLAKAAGKNRYHLFDPDSDRKAHARRKLLDRARSGLEAGEFVLHYQPKVDLDNAALVGVEALVRWANPDQGLLMPGLFLPALQGSPLDMHLGEWVIRTALAQAEAWRLEGKPVAISVNVSACHLLDQHFPEWLGGCLARYPDLPPASLELEILESVAIDDMARAIQVLRQCRKLGVHFALDDFGTGYSSLTYLRQLPVDTLKIDQTFVRDMLHDGDDLGIVEGVIRLAETFDREVVAEGVETLEHARQLRRMGCRFGQGYGIGRPMPAQELPIWLESWRQQSPALHLEASGQQS
ncbi:EAL domain-containing protein [Pseudomonas sp. QL9]|uniref:EAL domain-containing protein n=1 Tax=Pseudomonas sp. QL9 TaxID=3242725 RepID=UPI00352B0A3C